MINNEEIIRDISKYRIISEVNKVHEKKKNKKSLESSIWEKIFSDIASKIC